jgi:hypothetical protein
MCIVENSSSKRRKLVLAVQTLKLEVVRQIGDALRFATRALDTIRPAETLQIFSAAFLGRVEIVEFR